MLKNYIDAEWFFDQINVNTHCKLYMNENYCVLDQQNDLMCNETVDRLQNDEVHTKENCHLLCCLCNSSKAKIIHDAIIYGRTYKEKIEIQN